MLKRLRQWFHETYDPILVEGVQDRLPPMDGNHVVVDGNNRILYPYRDPLREKIAAECQSDDWLVKQIMWRFRVPYDKHSLLHEKRCSWEDGPYKYYDLGVQDVNLPPLKVSARVWLRRPAHVYIKVK